MKFPLSWLKEFISTTLSPQEIAHTLTMLGLEVEGMSFGPSPFENVVVGKVLLCTPHPNAEKLLLAKVSDGSQEFDIVCGAPNCRAGIKTAFAKVGAALTTEEGSPFLIKKSKIRGFPSQGMLCGHDELLLPEKDFGISGGIMEFPDAFKEGTDLREIFADTVFEVALTPNLGFAASLLGIARELAAAEELSVALPQYAFQEEKMLITEKTTVAIENVDLCPRYCCRMLTDVKVGPSPEWLAEKLLACGMRPINNVVDITNLVLLEFGHPLHAFDFDTLEGGKIVVRKAKNGEKITTLDDKEHFPTDETLLICDAKKPAAIAGVMGGKATEVGDATKTVLLEAAYFEPTSIRRASKRLGLITEASRRFERGTDPNALVRSLDRAASLIADIAGGKVVQGVIDSGKTNFPMKKIACRVSRTNAILGTQLSSGEMENIFTRLGFEIVASHDDIIELRIPTYRCDVSLEIDLIEEIARLYGFENLYAQKQVFYSKGRLPHAPLYLFEQIVREALLREGLQELLTSNLISPKLAEIALTEALPKRTLIHLLNPTSIDQSVLRPSLLPAMLQTVKWNADHGVHSLLGYEIGKVHLKIKDGYLEPTVVSLVLTGTRAPHHFEATKTPVDFFDLKGMIENLLKALHIDKAEYFPTKYTNFHPGRQAKILIDGHQVGMLGEVHPQTASAIDLQVPIYFAELNVEDLMQAPKLSIKMKPLPHFPATSRDLTLTLKHQCPIDKVMHLVDNVPSRLLEEFSLLDVYHSEKLGFDWKNVTFRFVYRDQEKTISFKSAELEHQRLTETIIGKLKTENLIKL